MVVGCFGCFLGCFGVSCILSDLDWLVGWLFWMIWMFYGLSVSA